MATYLLIGLVANPAGLILIVSLAVVLADTHFALFYVPFIVMTIAPFGYVVASVAAWRRSELRRVHWILLPTAVGLVAFAWFMLITITGQAALVHGEPPSD